MNNNNNNNPTTHTNPPCPRCGCTHLGWDGLRKPTKWVCARCRHIMPRPNTRKIANTMAH